MGDIADMMIDGDMDFYTGEYMGRGQGFPRTTDRSLPWETNGANSKPRAYAGVVNFCMQRGKTKSKAHDIIKRYGHEVCNIKTPKARGTKFWRADVFPQLAEISQKIQGDFKSFRVWYKANYENQIKENE